MSPRPHIQTTCNIVSIQSNAGCMYSKVVDLTVSILIHKCNSEDLNLFEAVIKKILYLHFCKKYNSFHVKLTSV